jgi:glycosyl transferase family 87
MQLWRRREVIWVAVAAVIVAVLGLHAFHVVAATRHEYPWDGKVDWFAARGWWAHVDPYSKEQLKIIKLDGLGHPPTTPFWFLPLASYDLHGMSFRLALFVVACLVAHLLLLTSALDAPRHPLARVAAVVAGTVVVLSTPWMSYHLNLAQLSELIAFFIVAGWYCVRRGWDVSGGIALGLACTFKFFPGLLVACLLFTRRFRVVAAATLTWLAVNAIMLSRFGLESWREFFAGNRILTEYWIGNLRNASIYGIVLRAFRPSCLGASRSIPAATLTATIIAVVVLAGLAWLTRRRWRDNATIDLPYALFAVAAYFFNPWIWEHYNALLIFPVVLAGVTLWRGRLTPADPPLPTAVRVGCALALAGIVGILLFLPLGYCAALYGGIKRPAIHFAMHVAEVANWISPVAMMTIFVVMLVVTDRRASLRSSRSVAN